jgi:hypothetical protein
VSAMRFHPPAMKEEAKLFEPINYTLAERIWGVLRFDAQVLRDIAECKPWLQILLLMVVSVLIQTSVSFAVSIIQSWQQITSLDLISSEMLLPFTLGFLMVAGMSLASAVIITLFGGLVYFALLRILGGKSAFKDTLAIYAFVQLIWLIVRSILGALPLALGMAWANNVLLVVSVLIMVSELTLAFSRLHDLSRLMTLAAVIASSVIVAVALIGLTYILNMALGLIRHGGPLIEFSKTIN